MAYICKSDLNIVAYRHFTVIIAGYKPSDRAVSVFHGIKWFYYLITRTSFRLAVLPFRLLHLDMRTVPQHNAAKITGRRRRIYLPPKAPGIQKRKQPRMIHMSMGQKHIVNQRFVHWQLTVLKHICALFHTIIHQNIFFTYTQIMTASRHLMICSNKHQLHIRPPALYSHARKSVPASVTVLISYHFFRKA